MKSTVMLGNLTIRFKLIVVIMLTSSAALLLASIVLIGSDFIQFHAMLERDLATMASIVADNSTAAIAFNDPAAAAETLQSVHAKPHIVLGCIYNAGGLFARYVRPGSQSECPAQPEPDRTYWTADSLNVFGPISLAGKRVGSLYLRSDLSETYDRLKLQVATLAAVLLVSAFFAFILSRSLQRVISEPILHLLHTTVAVSKHENYRIRARRQTNDELGQLVDSFNHMLDQIEERNSELQRARNELEARVDERTAQLQHELGERRRAEGELVKLNAELRQSNKELDDFAYIASHDLKEPLRGIHSYSAFLLEDYGPRFDDEARARLETLKRLSQRMETLIDTLLHFSRVGRLDLAYANVDLNEIVADAVETLAVRLKETGVQVRIPRPLPVVWADRAPIGEVFNNLIGNAMKYNDKAEKWVEIGVVDPNASNLVFYVRDNGIGIPAKHREAIFRIFKRLHARDKYGGGAGAGLTIVRKIVERHKGTVRVESVEGEGTVFFFTLNSNRGTVS